jgi:phospholipid/cholesterol/gamma-HCH transport system ATP-binding protein
VAEGEPNGAPLPEGAPHIRVVHATVRFGDVTAIEDINLEVGRGEIAVVIGGSGAGKTTLLKLMIGLIRPSEGSVTIEGEDVSLLDGEGLLRLRKKIGMVFQHAALLDSLSVFDNVALPLREHTKFSRAEIAQRVHDKLAALDLAGTESRLPAELSGGMKKRVGLARALVLEPSIVMYDEPTSGLDPITARRVDEMILETRERFSVTSVVISHDMVQAHHIADRLHLIDRGRLVASGSPRELQRQRGGLAERFFLASGIGSLAQSAVGMGPNER